MRFFSRFPTRWIQERQLRFLAPRDVWALKAMFGLAILWGRFERRSAKATQWFPASLTEIAEKSHLSRNDAQFGLDYLEARGLVVRVRDRGRSLGAHHRTSVFTFGGDRLPYFPFPYELVDAREFLGDLRRGQASLAALKIYLLLGTFRDRASKTSSLSHAAMHDYGNIPRPWIRRGVSLLINAGLVDVIPATPRVTYARYFIQGLEPMPPVHRVEEPAGPAHAAALPRLGRI